MGGRTRRKDVTVEQRNGERAERGRGGVGAGRTRAREVMAWSQVHGGFGGRELGAFAFTRARRRCKRGTMMEMYVSGGQTIHRNRMNHM